MAIHSEAWFRRSIQHVAECVAEADKRHTPEELVAAEMYLAGVPKAPQGNLFNSPAVTAQSRSE